MITEQERKEFKEFVFSKWEAALNSFRNDLALFCRDFLGYKDLNVQHQELCDFLLKGKKFKLILMPRYSFKSCICTVGYSLRELIFNPNLRILIYSDATTKAEGFLTSIKNHIEGKVQGSDFRNIFGAWETDPNRKGKWSNREIIISKRTSGFAEATIETAGIGTSLIGKHYDIIIFDDIVSDLNVTTKEQMDKVADCYSKALSLLVPGGEVLIIGTRWNFGDLYGRIIAENEEKQTFDIFIRSAEEDGKLLFEDIGDHSLTREFLDFQKKEQGSYIFSCLYQNSPVNPETAIFKPTDFSFYNEIDPISLYMTGTCDPAGVGKDFTAITVVGTDNEMNIYILDIVNKHLQPNEIVEEIIRLHYKWKFRIFGLETNFYRGTLKYELDRSIQLEWKENPKNFPNFGLHEFKPSARAGENKENRIRALQPYHERGVLKFPGTKLELLKGDYSELAYQMIQFPYSAHDDICLIAGTKIATMKGDKNIEDIKIGDKVITPFGIDEVTESKATGMHSVIENQGLIGTPNHKVFTYNKGEKSLDTLTYRDTLSVLTRKEVCQWIYKRVLYLMGLPIVLWGREDIISASAIQIKDGRILKDFMWRFGSFVIKGKFLKALIFTTKTIILLIMTQAIWNVYRVRNTINNLKICLKNKEEKCLNIWRKLDLSLKNGILLKKVKNGIVKILNISGRIKRKLGMNVFGVENLSLVGFPIINSAQELANKQMEEQAVGGMKQESVNTAIKNLSAINTVPINSAQGNVQQDFNSIQKVFNITVKNSGMYFANGILVSNCDSLAYHIPLIRKGGTVKEAGPPRHSPAWIERKLRDIDVSRQGELPRHLRKQIRPLIFS